MCRISPLVLQVNMSVVGTFPPPKNQLRESAFSTEVMSGKGGKGDRFIYAGIPGLSI